MSTDRPGSRKRYGHEFQVGDRLPTLRFPLSLYRLVMATGANRDFNAIHHNSVYAQQSGAPEAYANNLFLQGMWERSVRDFLGPLAQIHNLKGFRMTRFNTANDTVSVNGEVVAIRRENRRYYLQIKLWSETSQGISVGPGSITASLPEADLQPEC